MTSLDMMPTVVALLTAHANDDMPTAKAIVEQLDADQRMVVIGLLTEMLLHEMRLGCADAGVPLDEFLSIMGLAASTVADG